MSQKNGEIEGFVEELQAVAQEAVEVFGGLSAAQLNWKPSAEQWSVGQCFEHLIKTNRTFYPALEQVARGGRKSTLWERVSPLSGLFGWVVIRSLKSRRRFPAPGALKPSSSTVSADVIENFAAHQAELSGLMRDVGGVNLKAVVVTSPISAFVTYNMFDACRVVVAHERRHFAQAQRVTETPGFPAA